MKWTLNVNTHNLAYKDLDGRILENVHVELDCVLLDNIVMNLIVNYLTTLWWTWLGYGKEYDPWTCLVVLCNWNA
jgi:hypothetical protein